LADRYASFEALSECERSGRDFGVRAFRRNERTVVVAPHGGRIEPGTSEIAEAIAGEDFCFYAFEGTKPRHNVRLHITSTRFDEPQCLNLVSNSERVVTVHGEDSREKVVFLGGRDADALTRLRGTLERRGFCVKIHRNPRLQGLDQLNICNRGKRRAGIQLELSRGLRRSFFRSLSTAGRATRTVRFEEFVAAVRDAIM
jgi:phage replication-related protein YjqB (UPF0714/DUF867 family)